MSRHDAEYNKRHTIRVVALACNCTDREADRVADWVLEDPIDRSPQVDALLRLVEPSGRLRALMQLVDGVRC